jgi:1-deoxy-D-xylulose-5-phosphate synthase
MSFDIAKYPTLALVDSTQELRLLPKESLPKLCDELRRYLLDSVSRSSGHFASGLGTVELTVALHYVYNTPFDRLIWDVGHQAYPHKILTGRRDKIGTIRQKGGLHPFPWRGESEYDVLSVGHSSTSISAGIGVAIAAAKEDKQRRAVCVIGDGAITAGMAFEAMNHAGDIKPDLLVVLNDNEMSISENVGALNNHLAQLLSGKLYSTLREGGKKVFSGVPPIKELLKRTEEHIKGMVVPGTLFEELGFNYIGPVDGHDVLGLVSTLKNMRDLKGPQFLHIMTKKGRGYEPAEKDPITFHAVPKFDHTSGVLPKSSGGLPSYSKIFGDWLCETAAKDNKLMAITPAMREGSGMVEFSKKFPDRYFDVAIAEQHAVTFAAGLAIGDYKPVVAIYSTFLQRAYDQVIHDVAIQKLPVLFAIDRGHQRSGRALSSGLAQDPGWRDRCFYPIAGRHPDVCQGSQYPLPRRECHPGPGRQDRYFPHSDPARAGQRGRVRRRSGLPTGRRRGSGRPFYGDGYAPAPVNQPAVPRPADPAPGRRTCPPRRWPAPVRKPSPAGPGQERRPSAHHSV